MESLVHNNNTERMLRTMTDEQTWRKIKIIIYLDKMLIILRVVYLNR